MTSPTSAMDAVAAGLLHDLRELTEFHRERSSGYAKILKVIGYGPRAASSFEELPWLPARLFKDRTLSSIPDEKIVQRIHSSGTTGVPSRVAVDRQGASDQARSLVEALSPVIGSKRLPMLIIDSRRSAATKGSVSARGAGILGMMTFGRAHVFALDEDEALDRRAVEGFLRRHGGGPFLVFGFTFMVWRHLLRPAEAWGWDLSRGVLVHGGGWKRMEDEAVSPEDFRLAFATNTGLLRSHSFYGMTEQMGTVFVEGDEAGVMCAPPFARVLIRDPDTWAAAAPGRPGLLQVMSTRPHAYPGHVVLTEDLGEVVYGSAVGTIGGAFRVRGRLAKAEVRGCSDAVAA
ncbi:LuxE/PaaK family acyltransferase [Microbacterium enclense]|uniref:LuxE/PaaK family acyltransferase n=1 Tax=Microbacterium enclense TaxID=993073 RepID=UPI003F81BE89